MGTIKEINSMDLTEAEEIEKRWHKQRTIQKNFFITHIITVV